MKYQLMNKDRLIATLDITDTIAHITGVHDSIPGYIGNIQNWIDSRTSPVGRQNINTLLKLAEISTKQEFLCITHGISLIDTLWVRKCGEVINWEQINPYKNRFSRIISEVAINGTYYGGNLRSPSPEYTLDGSADKCWKRENGQIYLYKTSGEKWSGITGNRPYCEYYASQVADKLIPNKQHFVHYRIKVSKTKNNFNKPYVYCPIFTSERYGYVSIGESKFRYLGLEELDEMLPRESRIILREMLVLDSIILNYDRHNGNYGFIADNDTYNLKSFAPIFDNDCSLGGFVSLQSVNSLREAHSMALLKQPRTEMGDYIEQAHWAMTKQLYHSIKNMYPFHFNRLPKEIDLEDERIEFMEYIVNSQIKAIIS